MTTISIMQPTYLSWSGYYDLIDKTDIFVLLDTVQFNKRSWQQRNRIRTSDGDLMLTVPVFSKREIDQKINEVKIDYSQKFPAKHIQAIKHNYSKSMFFKKYFDEMVQIYEQNFDKLVDLNLALIQWIAEKLGIDAKLVLASSMNVSGTKVDLLLSICKQIKADNYLSPIGSKTYIDENNLFDKNGIKLDYQNYLHPTYNQLDREFIPYLSVIDLLLNEGEKSLDIIRSGRRY